MISPKKFCAHEVLGRPIAFGRVTSVLCGRKSQNLKSLDHFWHVPTLSGDLSWRPCQRFHRLTLLICNWAQALREGEGAHIGVQLCPISAFSTEKFNWPAARGTYSIVYRRKSTYKKVKPMFVIFHFESGNQDRYCRKIDAHSAMFTSYLSQFKFDIPSYVNSAPWRWSPQEPPGCFQCH